MCRQVSILACLFNIFLFTYLFSILREGIKSYCILNIWAGICQKVPYTCNNQILANVKSVKVLPLKSIFWKLEAIIFNIEE